MNHLKGGILFKTLFNLGVDTCNVSENTLEAWFDTDCTDTKHLLNWMCMNLSSANVLLPQETEEFEDLVRKKLVLSGEKYKHALTDLNNKHPGILDPETTVFEIECQKDQITVLQDEITDQKQLLKVHEQLNNNLSREISKATEKEIISGVQKEEAFEQCLKLSIKLDDTYCQLQQQIFKYKEVLTHNEYTPIPLDSYEQFCADAVSYVDLTISKELLDSQKLNGNVETTIITNQEDELKNLYNRIHKSTCNNIFGVVEEEKLRAKNKYLKSNNINEIIRRTLVDDSYQLQLKTNLSFKNIQLEQLFMEVQHISAKIAELKVNRPKLSYVKQKLPAKLERLEKLNSLVTFVNKLLSYHLVYYIQLDKEKCDLKMAEEFLGKVHRHITHELQSCEIRTNTMLKVINDNKTYKMIPIEQKCKFMQSIGKLLSENTDDQLSLVTTVDLMNKFHRERNSVAEQIFHTDFVECQEIVRKIDESCMVMKTFLANGPTNQLIAIPLQLLTALRVVDSTLNLQQNVLTTATQLTADAEKKLKLDKWFRTRRLLWMQFLTEPSLLLSSIEQIREEIKHKRNEII